MHFIERSSDYFTLHLLVWLAGWLAGVLKGETGRLTVTLLLGSC